MSAVAIASAGLKALRGIRGVRARDGWTPALVTQSLALARIAGALALDRPVAQAAAPNAAADEGQVLVTRGALRRRAVLLSAPLTPQTLVAAQQRIAWPERRPLLADVHAALVTFGEARYARTSAAHEAELDAALERIAQGLQRARILAAWPVRAVAGVRGRWRSLGLTWAS
jgi:hypothetical protein